MMSRTTFPPDTPAGLQSIKCIAQSTVNRDAGSRHNESLYRPTPGEGVAGENPGGRVLLVEDVVQHQEGLEQAARH